MDFQRLLGRVVSLPILRFAPPGAFLALDPHGADPDGPCVLLPKAEVPQEASAGQSIEVFVHLDSEDRPIATTRRPMLVLDHVAFLTVSQIVPFGAFVDWGLPKELLVPRAEQTGPIRPGERHPFGLILDRTGRLAGTMRVAEMLKAPRAAVPGEWLEGEAWRNEPEIGVFVILEKSFVGLLPAREPHSLRRGMAARFRVAAVLPDGKLELSLRGPGHEEIEGDARMILASLESARPPRVGDASSPEQIRALFGLSKKAFKRAIGRLLREGIAEISAEGFVRARRR